MSPLTRDLGGMLCLECPRMLAFPRNGTGSFTPRICVSKSHGKLDDCSFHNSGGAPGWGVKWPSNDFGFWQTAGWFTKPIRIPKVSGVSVENYDWNTGILSIKMIGSVFFSDRQLVCWFAVQQFLWTWQIRTSILCSMVGELYLPMAEMNQLLWRFCPRFFVNIADVAWFSSMNSKEANEFTWCGCSICFLA